jgi:putative ABC transport system permease protein
MPAGFSFPQNQDLWIPLVPAADLQRRDARTLWFAFGRMADGVTIESARAELETIGSRLASAYPRTNQAQVPRPHNFAEFFIGPSATMMYGAMWGAVGFVLLIACANVANLLLARAIGRYREISVRMALGAGHWRIIRQLLIESVLLSAIGGFFGWWIATWGVRAYELATNPPVGEWRRDLLDYTMDYRVFAYVMAISLGTGLLFGFAPALRLARLDLNTVLKSGGRTATGGGRGKRLSGLLVIGEVSLAVVLLTGAGVMIRSFLNIYTADIGARTADTRTMLLHLPEAKYLHREAQISFFDRLKTRLEAIPGVESASIGLSPASGIPGRRPYEPAGVGPVVEQNRPTIPVVAIGPDYFRTLGATVLSGREFNKLDGASGVPAAVVNQRFATQHWPEENAVGQRLRLFDGKTPEPWLTVVGVVSNIVYDPSRQEITPVVYLPYGPRPGGEWVLVRTPLPVGALVTTFRREINALDPDVIIWLGPYNLDDRAAGGRFGNIRNHTVLFLIFASMALLLASIGLYAVIAHSVSQRTQEIGVRMAVGATARDILKLVIKLGMFPVAIGLVIGLAASFAVNRVLSSDLVRISPTDSITFVIACAVLVLSAALGCWIPARRAVRLDPIAALREE